MHKIFGTYFLFALNSQTFIFKCDLCWLGLSFLLLPDSGDDVVGRAPTFPQKNHDTEQHRTAEALQIHPGWQNNIPTTPRHNTTEILLIISFFVRYADTIYSFSMRCMPHRVRDVNLG